MPWIQPSGVPGSPDDEAVVSLEVESQRLARILEFCGLELSDCLGSVVEARRVEFYMNLGREIDRTGEVRELEKQWNPSGLLR